MRALPNLALRKRLLNGLQDAVLVGGPEGCQQQRLGAVAGDPVDDGPGRQHFQTEN